MDTIETVKIISTRHERGYVIINKSDFDPATQELYSVEKKDDDQPKRQYNRKS